MFRIILIITLILIAIPLFNKAKNYMGDMTHKAKALGQTTVKAVKYLDGEREK
jgi:hypothetical protein